MQLMREEAHASPKERTESVGLAQRQQMQDLEPENEICGLVGVTCRQPLEQRAFELKRPQFIRRRYLLVGKAQAAIGKPQVDDGLLTSGEDPDVTTRTEIDRQERIGRGRKP
jgi:hypothetical protein